MRRIFCHPVFSYATIAGMNSQNSSTIQFQRATLETCEQAEGLVVVIDVLRAFSTAAYAFGAGAAEILLAGSIEEALALRQRFPEALLMGEMGGRPVAGFDFSNSPAGLVGHDLSGRRLIQRTSAGTQGVVRSRRADEMLAGSLLVASATARCIQKAGPASVTFVVTGANAAGWGDEMVTNDSLWGDEDAALADYLEAVLSGLRPETAPYLQRVWDSPSGRIFTNPALPEFPAEDVGLCAQIDRFDFCLRIRREDDLLVMRPEASQGGS
jgi:2-phosphosulfolactate phosphatase